MVSIGQSSTFSKYGHGAHQIKENHECINMVANILLADPPPPPSHHITLEMGSIGRNSTFSEQHAAYQIKWNHEMQQHVSKNILPKDPPQLP